MGFFDDRSALAFRVSPGSFGGDPTGATDATSAVEAAVAALLNHTRSLPKMASGITNAGGAMLDLAGGAFLISRPVVLPTFLGNFRIGGSGTLRASPSFPASRYLIEIGSSDPAICKPHDQQRVCNEFVTISDVFLDAAHVAAGGISVSMTMGTTITNSFVTGFTTAGILVEEGHETMVSEAWLAEDYWSGGGKGARRTCDKSVNGRGSVGILINGQDNIVSDVIIFDFTCLGVWVNGAANLLTGVHSWNGGGVAISINGTYDVQDRVVDCYLDYSTLEIVNPQFVLVQGNFFLDTHLELRTTGGKPAANLEVRENIYSLNQYGGNASVVVAPGAVCGRGVVVEDEINAKQGGGTQRILQTRVRKSQDSGKSGPVRSFVLDFSADLLFGSIDWVSYALEVDPSSTENSAARALSHWSVRLNGTAVKVASAPVSGTVHMEVAECSR